MIARRLAAGCSRSWWFSARALGFSLWAFASTRLTPTQVAVYIDLNPLVAMVLAAALLAERLTIVFVAGFGAVVLGVLLVDWPRRAIGGPR